MEKPVTRKHASNTDVATRAFVVSLKALSGKTNAEIEELTGLKTRLINQIYARAIAAGFDPNARPIIIRTEWLEDKPRSGRPSKGGPELTSLAAEKVSTDRYGREKTCAEIADEISRSGLQVSEATV